MSCKFVFFDLGNVITFFDHQKAVRLLMPECGISESELSALVNDSELKTQYEKGLIDSQTCHRRFCELAQSQIEFEDFMQRLSDIFWLNAGLVPLLTSLKTAGIPLGILSNTCEAHWEYLAGRITFLNDFFDCHVLSYRVQSLKPEPEIYAAASKASGYAPGETFFTDDRPEHIAAARSAGWHAEPFEDAAKLSGQLQALGINTNY